MKAGNLSKAGLRLVAGVGLAFLLASCYTARLEVSQKENITSEKIEMLKKGVTTRAKVESAFGAPMDKVVFKDGEKYFYKDFNLRTVYMEFDKNGVLTDFERTK